MNNQIDLPNYKYYVDARSGQRFDGFVTFLNLYPSENSQILGILFEVNDQEIQHLDLRERNYQRLEISDAWFESGSHFWTEPGSDALPMPLTESWEFPTSCPTWVYSGLDAAVQRYQQGMTAAKIAIAQPYAAAVTAAYASLGPAALQNYQTTTDPPTIPTLPLRRIDSRGNGEVR